MMLQAPAEDALLVAFATRGEREYVERFAATLPPTVRLHRIEADTEGAGAALSLLARSMRSFERLVETWRRGANAARPLPRGAERSMNLSMDASIRTESQESLHRGDAKDFARRPANLGRPATSGTIDGASAMSVFTRRVAGNRIDDWRHLRRNAARRGRHAVRQRAPRPAPGRRKT